MVRLGNDFLDSNHFTAIGDAAQHNACSAAPDKLDGPKVIGQNKRVLQAG
jgi:hypothetical protein